LTACIEKIIYESRNTPTITAAAERKQPRRSRTGVKGQVVARV